ncbi:MAG: PKD domain-containing protein [Chitinophagales bacterium]
MLKILTLLFTVAIITTLFNTANATVYDVNSLAASNTGTGNSGTLYYCITQANQTVGPHSINFSVAGTININTSGSILPALNKQISIDATTAPGYAGAPVIILDGTGAGGGNGIEITAADCELYGLEIANFSGRGIYVHGNNADNYIIGAAAKGNVVRNNEYYGISIDASDNGVIAYNKIGTDATGDICAGNYYNGIDLLNGADYTQVLFNYVSCNQYNGLQIGGSSYNEIKGNIIGPLKTQCQGNSYRGIDIEDGSQYNIIGGTNAADFNKIAGNLYWGIEVKNNSPNNLISGNSYVCNVYGAIVLANNGNNNMAAPAITTANTLLISGTAAANANIQIFKSQNTNPTQCTGTPSNQGADYIASTNADASGNWSLSGNFGGYVTATATDANDNTSAFSTSISTGATDTLINECSGYIPFITASFNTSTSTVCEKQCINFTDQSLNAASWHWTFEGGTPVTSALQNPDNICYSEPGIFAVTLTVYGTNGIDSSVAVLYVTVNATPTVPLISQQGDTLTSTASVAYQWYLNTIIIPGATDQQYIVSQNGYYSVEITDSVDCSAISTADYIDITGIGDSQNDQWIKILTDHQSGAIQLFIYGMTGKAAQLRLVDLYGRTVKAQSIFSSSPVFTQTLQLPDNVNGYYFIQLKTSEKIWVEKLLLHNAQ